VINQINFPPALRRQVRDLIAIGGRITRDGVTVVVDGPAEVAGSTSVRGWNWPACRLMWPRTENRLYSGTPIS
jgi:hypothetical protein